MSVNVLAIAVLGLSWLICNVVYHYVWRRWLKWWAAPFAMGALLTRTRMEQWER